MSRLALLALLAILALAPTQSAPASPTTETEHVVQEGETLNGIANRAGVSPEAVAKANKLKPPGFAVRIGQKLIIPRSGAQTTSSPGPKASVANSGATHTVEEGETLLGIANRAGVSLTGLAKVNGIEEPYPVRVGQVLKIPGRSSPTEEKKKTTASAAYSHRVVEEGETLGEIAADTGVPRIVIAEANDIAPPYIVRPGQKLVIPRQRTHIVQKGDTGFALAYRYGVPFEQIAMANGLKPDATLVTGQKLLIPALTSRKSEEKVQGPAAPASTPAPKASSRFRWPLTGTIKHGFDPGALGAPHNGVDIIASEGAPVKAAADGIIIYAQMEKKRFGNLVIIDHGDRWHTAYGYLARIAVKKGATVTAGEVIGLAGSTGLADSPQLHFELRRFNKPIDPVAALGPAE